MNYSFEEIDQRMRISLGILFKNDIFLLKNDVSERAVAHKLAEYMQQQFLDWNVDCEYNRKGLDKKKLVGIRECSDERSTDIVIPDIIVHRRNESAGNLLVIEIKTRDNDTKCDFKKLELFTSTGDYKYKFGLFIKFKVAEEPDLIWFSEGNVFP